ncbi:MAG: aminoglycoside phosphotransferase family protein [Bacteroidota bacterium]
MEALNKILEQFQIPEVKYKFEIISNGFINDTYMVSAEGRPEYILQRINTDVFTNIDALMHNLDLVLPLLKHDDYKTIKLVKTALGDSFIKTETNHVWRLMTFIKDSLTYNTTTNPKVAFEAGKIIGLFHTILNNFDAELLEDTLPNFHNVSYRYQQFNEALVNAKPDNIKNSQKAIDFVKKNIELLLKIKVDDLPVKVCHNDTKLNNILFSNKKALCLIDLDTIMKGTFLYDFGDAVRTIANTADEDEKNLSKINFTNELFDAFVDGLAVHKDSLAKKEIDFLSLGVVLMPFLHGIRALTDYLENNRYYKVSYETQNLDRCMSLFTFAQLALDKQKYMKKRILDKLC